MSKISIIITCYFNEGNIPVTTKVLIENEKNFPTHLSFEYVFVDDGSKDNTYLELIKFQKQYPEKVKVLKLARNYGANNASYAGICNSTGDCCVILASDLQDPPELIPQLYQHWEKGYKLVLAYKANREDSATRRFFSWIYHSLVRKFVLRNAPKGGFDLWLFDKLLRDEIIKMNEKNFYLPYVFIWMGFEYVSIPYTRRKREIGKSGWTASKKIKSFVDSFVSFTYLPLRIISFAGIFFGLIAIIYSISIFVTYLMNGALMEGWSSLMVVLLFSSSFIMISLGILGEYIWRTLDASRNRPNFIIDKVIDETKQS
jgi:dolichol-phosphate mannosyltransferase